MVYDFTDPDTDPKLIELHCAYSRTDLLSHKHLFSCKRKSHGRPRRDH